MQYQFQVPRGCYRVIYPEYPPDDTTDFPRKTSYLPIVHTNGPIHAALKHLDSLRETSQKALLIVDSCTFG